MKKIDAEIKALEVGLGFFKELKVVASPTHIVDSGASVMPVKELTDEKITAIAKEIFKDYKNFHHYQIDFARAVIKEVSEK
jgi:hypothetical protein